MKKACLLVILFFCACITLQAQKIQYSRQTVKKLYTDDIQLVTNIGGNHHLLRLNVNKNPVIYIYNEQLQLIAEETIGHKIKDNLDTRVLSFNDHYYFYTHAARTSQHALYGIDGNGGVTELTKAFQRVVDSLLNSSTATLQLVNQNNRLYAMAHVYYDTLKSIGTTVVELDENIRPVAVQKAFYRFNVEEDRLKQTMLVGNSLLVMKTARTEDKGNSLDVIKVNLATGKAFIKSFNSGSSEYSDGNFRLNKDSNMLVYATLGAPGSARGPRAGFFSCLNPSLEEVTPFALLQSPFRSYADANYFLLADYTCWLNLHTAKRALVRGTPWVKTYSDFPASYYGAGTTLSQGATLPPDAQIIPTYPTALPNTAPTLPHVNRNPAASIPDTYLQSRVGFTMLDKQLKTTKDSIAIVKRYEFGIQPHPFAQAILNNIPSLFLIENFTESRRRLLMITGKKEELLFTDINVFDKYEYVLEQLKAVNNHSVILPYIHKNGAGLVKISFN